MSELKIETPKKKRRTKAEMEAARAAGTEPAKRARKKVVESKDDKTAKAPEEHAAKTVKKLPAEQSVILMSCLNPTVSKVVIKEAKKNNVEVVILEDRIIHDYLTVRNREDQDKRDLEAFLDNTSNRLHAEDQAVKLWMILTGGNPIENANKRVFTTTEVVKKTNLTHGNTAKVLQLLKVFGILEFVKGQHEFILNFDKKRCHETIKIEIVSVCQAINKDIMRFKKSIDADDSMSKEEKENVYKMLKKQIDEIIEF